MLAVDNFSTTNIGYTILFDDPDTDILATDIRKPAGHPPRLASVIQTPTCLNDTLIFHFTTEVRCSDITNRTFEILNTNFPNDSFHVSAVLPVTPCGGPGGASQDWKIAFENLRVDTGYSINIRSIVRDLCGNDTSAGSLHFSIRPYVQLVPTVLGTPQDSICCNREIVLLAQLDSATPGEPRDFLYDFFLKDPTSGALTPIGDLSQQGYTQDSTSVQATLCFPGLKTPRTVVVAARSRVANIGCPDTNSATFRVLPEPILTLTKLPGLCFGESATLRLTDDTSQYNFTWQSSIATPRTISKSGVITFIGDTADFVTENGTEIHRGRRDALTLNASYKTQYGSCSITPYKDTVNVGAYMVADFTFDEITRPGKPSPPTYAIPRKIFTDHSRVRSLTGDNRYEHWTISSIDAGAPGQIAAFDKLGPLAPTDTSVSFDFTTTNGEGNYQVKLAIRDTLSGSDHKVCEVSAIREFQNVVPVVPTLLTRNGDNVNDYFEIPGLKQASNYTLLVTNRWGRKVFEQNNYDNSFSGADLPPGIYFYYLSPNNGGTSYRGWIELQDKK